MNSGIDNVYIDTVLPKFFVPHLTHQDQEHALKDRISGKIVRLELESYKVIQRDKISVVNGQRVTYPEVYGLFRDTNTGLKYAFYGRFGSGKVAWVSLEHPDVWLMPSCDLSCDFNGM